jgi:hypothetical protein
MKHLLYAINKKWKVFVEFAPTLLEGSVHLMQTACTQKRPCLYVERTLLKQTVAIERIPLKGKSVIEEEVRKGNEYKKGKQLLTFCFLM